jgi:hypothetical protein
MCVDQEFHELFWKEGTVGKGSFELGIIDVLMDENEAPIHRQFSFGWGIVGGKQRSRFADTAITYC